MVEDSMQLELEGLRTGDAEALGRALKSCREYLLMVAKRRLDADLIAKGGASDLVQETLLGAYRNFAGFRGRSRAELLAWLSSILRNNLADLRRRYRGTGKRRVRARDSDRLSCPGSRPPGVALRFGDAGLSGRSQGSRPRR